MDRRGFLKGAFSGATLVALPAISGIGLPVLYGDGKHDDTKGLQAAINGEPFRTADGFVGRVEAGLISGGVFKISDTIVKHSDKMITLECGVLDATEVPFGKYIMEFIGSNAHVRGKSGSNLTLIPPYPDNVIVLSNPKQVEVV